MILGQSIRKNSIIMGLFAIVTTGLIVLTQVGTADQIEFAKRQALEKALQEIVPTSLFDNKLLENTVEISANKQLGSKKIRTAYIATKDDAPAAIILQATAPEGYGGSIHFLVGIRADGVVTGVRVVPPHFETPGLGDKIDLAKSNWILSFNGKSLANLEAEQWKVKKDGGQFDAFTGATITPRAIVDGVHKSLQYFDEHKLSLFGTQTAFTVTTITTPDTNTGTSL
ncbi:electron transport complex subunit G [Gammaproteobacteria bacterium 42_54_T18]|nr:electron transport complex subunit G [Gammaproteobacteria bacterium 42_54_T18]